MSEFGRVCEIKLRVNVGKSKVMRCSRHSNGSVMHVILNGEPLEEVDKWQLMEDVKGMWYTMNAGYTAWESLKCVLSNRGLVINSKNCLYEVVILPTALYRAEAWGMRSADRRKVNVLEMICLRSLVGLSRMDRVRNEEVRRRSLN